MCSLCRLPVAKNHNFGQILIFWELLYRSPFTYEGQIWCAIADPRLSAKFRLDRFILSSSGGEKPPIFATFWTSAYSVVANWQQSDKLEHGAQLQTFLYPTASKSFLYANDFMAKSGAQSLTFKSVTNKQTNKQTDKKNSTFLATPAAGEIRASPNLAW